MARSRMIIAVIYSLVTRLTRTLRPEPGLFRRVTAHNCPEIIRIEAGAAHESAVDLGESEDGPAVARVHRPAIKDADAGWCATPDLGMHRCDVFGGCG